MNSLYLKCAVILLCVGLSRGEAQRDNQCNNKTLVCGLKFVLYDESCHTCKNGQLVTLETDTTISTTTPRPRSPAPSIPTRNICESHAHKRMTRYKCCGSTEMYNPDFATCCTQMDKTRVHHNKPEKKYVCCGLEAFERGHQSCIHVASNDALWSPKPLKDLRQSTLCSQNVTAYLVQGIRKPENPGEENTIRIHKLPSKVNTNNRKSRRRRWGNLPGKKLNMPINSTNLHRKGVCLKKNLETS